MEKCQCLTTKGIQCSRKAISGSNYCLQHKTCKIPIQSKTPIQSKVQIADKSPLILTKKEFEDAIANDDANAFYKYDLNVIANLFTHLNIQLDKLIETNKPNIVKYALNNKLLNPNSKYGGDNAYALIIAMYENNNEIAKILLMNPKIDVNLQSNDGESILEYAIHRENYEIVKILLEHPKIDVNLGNNGSTPLMEATLGGIYGIYGTHESNKIAKILLDNPEINVNLQDSYGNTALMFAVKNHEIFLLLIENPNIDVNLQNEDGETALMIAINNSRYEVVKLLINHPNIDVNSQDKHGYTPLMKAMNNSYEIVKLLLGHSEIDIDIESAYGYTAFQYATNTHNLEMIELFEG